MICSSDGFDRITLKVIFQVPKGLKQVKCGSHWLLYANLLKTDNFSLYLVCRVFGHDIDRTVKRSDFIAAVKKKQCTQVGKVRFSPSCSYSVD